MDSAADGGGGSSYSARSKAFETMAEEAAKQDEKPTRPFVLYSLRHTFLTRLGSLVATYGRWRGSQDTLR